MSIKREQVVIKLKLMKTFY